MDGYRLSLHLLSPTDMDDDTFQHRQGFWLRMARERAGKSQAGAARFLGLSENSKSSVSDYETGVTPPSLKTLRRLARWYGVPLDVFTEPGPTAFERLDELAGDAAALALEDQGTVADDGQDDAPQQVA